MSNQHCSEVTERMQHVLEMANQHHLELIKRRGDKRLVRSNREAWIHVQKITGDRWKCNFCGEEKTGKIQRVEAHLGGVPGYGIAVCKGNVLPGLRKRMQNAANLRKENKKRKLALVGSGSSGSNAINAEPPPSDVSNSSPLGVNTSTFEENMWNIENLENIVGEIDPQVTFPQQESSLSDFDDLFFSQETGNTVTLACEQAHTNISTNTQEANASVQAPVEGRENGVRGNVFGAGSCQPQTSSNTREANTGVQAPEEGGRENGIGQNMFGAGSCQPQASSNTLEANAGVQPLGAEGREKSIGHNMFGAGSYQPQTSTHGTLLRFTSDIVQPINDQDPYLTFAYESLIMLEDLVKKELKNTLASTADQWQCHESASTSEGTEDFSSLAARVRELSQTEVDARQLVQNMLKLVRKLKTLTSEQADVKTRLEETESVTVKKRTEMVDNWLQRGDQVKEEFVHEFNDTFQSLLMLNVRMITALLEPPDELRFLDDLERKSNRIEELIKEVDELLKEGKSLLDLTVDVVLPRKVINCRSQLQHFVEEHFKLILEMT